MSEINRDSPTGNYLRSRRKINCLLQGDNSRGPPLARCPSCQDQPRLLVKVERNGRIGVCVKGCGQSYPLENNPANLISDGGTKYVTRFGTTAGGCKTFIVSQKRKKTLKPGELDQEEKSDLSAALGSSIRGEGVSKVDERSFTYDGGGWH